MRKIISILIASFCFLTLCTACGISADKTGSVQSVDEESFICILPDPLVIEVVNNKLIFSTIASNPETWYTTKRVENRMQLRKKDRIKNDENNLLHTFFTVLDGKTVVADYTNTFLTDFVYFTTDYDETIFYCFAFNPEHGVFTITDNNELLGTAILSESETATIVNAVNAAKQ